MSGDAAWWALVRPDVARDMPDLLPRLDAAWAAGGSPRAEMIELLREHNLDISRITIRTLHLRVALAYAQQLGNAGVVELSRRSGLPMPDDPGVPPDAGCDRIGEDRDRPDRGQEDDSDGEPLRLPHLWMGSL